MAARKKIVKKTRPRKNAANGNRRTINGEFVLESEELATLNCATGLLELAKVNLARTWRPIRAKYGLAQGITYDRDTGQILEERNVNGEHQAQPGR